MSKFAKYYSKSLEGHKGYIHLASHSHYFWPDISLEGQKKYWELATKQSDEKWSCIFQKEIPKAQKIIAKILNFSHPQRIAFAPNTQELLNRVLSSFNKKLKILTTSSEFHSAKRQLLRLQEEKLIDLSIIENEQPHFEEKFLDNISDTTDIIFISQVFFNSGLSCSKEFIQKIISKKKTDTILIIDGYHGFCAVETDLSDIIEDIYYIAGGYKYAQAGEGMCFMTTPLNGQLRPKNTGWFADFSSLENSDNSISYSNDGFRFASSTLDFSALFRFNSIWDFFHKENLTYTSFIHESKQMQQYFLEKLSPKIKEKLVTEDSKKIGLFICFKLDTNEDAQNLYLYLKENKILSDKRNKRLRLSFPVYHTKKEINFIIQSLERFFK